MRFTDLVRWSLLAGLVSCNPLKLDLKVDNVDLHLDIDHREVKPPSRAKTRPSALTSSTLPIATLGYELHQASPDIDTKQTYYNFSNVPYAHQPIGERRFKEAKFRDDWVDDPKLNDGQQAAICPQGFPGWLSSAGAFSQELFKPGDALDSKWLKEITPSDYPPISTVQQPPNQNESCLLLDIFVDKTLYDDQNAPLVPVIISFHGGGYTYGSKHFGGSPSSILEQAGQFKDGKVIVVSVNYRLGAFGWLAGEEFKDAGGFGNAGFSDQVAAIEWVQSYIQVFGGNPYEITLLGESAGASSIMHHLTAYAVGGIGRSRPNVPRPKFQRAILQSPAYFPTANYSYVNQTYRSFLKAAGAKDFKDLQSKPMADLIKANSETVYQSPYGLFTYGPFTSGDFSGNDFAGLPPILLLNIGVRWQGIDVMVANNRREGSVFTPPWLRTAGGIKEHLLEIYPNMNKKDVEEFVKLYPVPQILTTPKAKFLYSAAPFGDFGIDCNAWALRKAYSESYEYYYRLYPGFHGQDVGATWWPNAGEDLSKLNVEEQSLRLQRYLTSFAKFGNPNEHKLEADAQWPSVSDKKYMYIGDGELRIPPFKDKNYGPKTDDPLPSEDICGFWASVPWWGNGDDTLARLTEQLQVQAEL